MVKIEGVVLENVELKDMVDSEDEIEPNLVKFLTNIRNIYHTKSVIKKNLYWIKLTLFLTPL